MTNRNPRSTGLGDLLRAWRRARGLSQMRLAHMAGISPRHLSFVETGRSGPSRDVVEALARALDLPLREENTLLETAGYARRYGHTRLDAPEMAPVRKVLRFLLDRHMPHAALVMDRSGRILMENEAQRATIAALTRGRGLEPEIEENIYRLAFHPEGLRPIIANFDVVAATLMARMQADLEETPSLEPLRSLLSELRGMCGSGSAAGINDVTQELLLPIHLRFEGSEVRLFTTFTTLGTPLDVTMQELRIETFFPADAESEGALGRLLA